MIFDILIILIILLFVLLGVWRGAARTLLNLAAVTVSAIIARFAASALAAAVYEHFIKKTVTDNITRLITESGEQYAAQHSMQALPGGVKSLIGVFSRMFGVAPDDLQGRLVSSTAQPEQVARAIEKPLGELTICILSVLIMLVLFIALSLVLKAVIRLTLGFFELPVVRGLNKLLGGVLGAVEGLVVVLVAVNLVYILVSCTNPAAAENNAVFGRLFEALILFK